MASLQKIVPNLWFDKNAEEAVRFYTSVFKDSSLGRITHYGKEGHEIHGMPEGAVLTIEFRLEGQDFLALNGGPTFKFTEAISFIINCEDQKEIDYYWERLREGGDETSQVCGWLKDKFGVSWQVTPMILGEMLLDKDAEKVGRVMNAFLKMKKIEIKGLEDAYDGK